MAQFEEISGVFQRERWRSTEPDSDFAIGFLRNRTTIKGSWPLHALLTGITYRFFGKWVNHKKYGRQFQVDSFAEQVPLDRRGVFEYLKRLDGNAKIGERTIDKIIDLCGAESTLATLRTDPFSVVEKLNTTYFREEKANAVAKALTMIQEHEETKIQILAITAGFGFRATAIDQIINEWGLDAPKKIRENPFCLLKEKISGCGFMLVDKLYLSLGLAPDAMCRQTMAVWYVVNSDRSGSTWHLVSHVRQRVGELITGVLKSKEAIETSLEEGRLVYRKDDVAPHHWLADSAMATQEDTVSEELCRMIFTEDDE